MPSFPAYDLTEEWRPVCDEYVPGGKAFSPIDYWVGTLTGQHKRGNGVQIMCHRCGHRRDEHPAARVERYSAAGPFVRP